jgi:hypothetical protein
VTRVVSATIFSLSLTDPQALSEAKRRGLSKREIDHLHTFVFTDMAEVNNDCCSICLSEFDIGEMLICLPCDQNKETSRGSIGGGLRRILTHRASPPVSTVRCGLPQTIGSSSSSTTTTGSIGSKGALKMTAVTPQVSQEKVKEKEPEAASHSFHAACIREWLKIQNCCPLCKTMVYSRELMTPPTRRR